MRASPLDLLTGFMALMTVIALVTTVDVNRETVCVRGERGKALVMDVPENRTVSLRYTHSVRQMVTIETYHIERGAIVLRSVKMGDGASSALYDEGMSFMDGGAVRIEGVNVRLGGLKLRVGDVGRPVLTVGNTQIDLSDVFGPGEGVEISLDGCA
ncbi:MAG: DUF1850 domain-containing protein [Thaumarchaeota archaeon]|nr:DUF1850 domain-containing protein [Candidatus Calditenuaceae archaeon]MCX8202777.1 DUF1850 domain-containing protein [Nitrososphaeria archaeon]